MARKQNQKALYEAIRQGQAKIAEGLKTGQMRSDRKRFAKSGMQSTAYVPPAAQSEYDETEYGSHNRSFMSPKKALILLAVIVQILVLVLGIWLGAAYFEGKQQVAEQSAEDPKVAEPIEPVAKTALPIIRTPVRRDEPQAPVRPAELPPVVTEPKPQVAPVSPEVNPPAGNNVIVIQGIEPERKDLLLPLKDFFLKKGIQTEVIVSDSRGLLVTSEKFETNPESRATPGYELLQQIKAAGLLYPKETGDTKFGIKPFQDCYGLKIDN